MFQWKTDGLNTFYAINQQDSPFLTFTANSAGSTIKLAKNGSPTSVSLQYKLNDDDWTDYTINSEITLTNISDKVAFKSTTSTFSSSTSNYYYFVMTGSIKASGNTNSLINYGNLTNYCFFKLFYNCKVLTNPPSLPATTLANYCYYLMFYNCIALISMPKLPATILTSNCYRQMFYGCKSLYIVYNLSAKILATRCCQQMFYSCKSLTKAPELFATTLASYCYYQMFSDCTSLTKAPKLPATSLVSYCYQNMFQNCISLSSAPELSATSLASYCYTYMFDGCTSLNNMSVKFTQWSENTTNWLQYVAATGLFYMPDELIVEYGDSRIPNGWTPVCSGISTCDQTIQFTNNITNTKQIYGYATGKSIIYTSNNLPNQLMLTSGGIISGKFNEQTSGLFNVTLAVQNLKSKTIQINYQSTKIPYGAMFHASFKDNNNWVIQSGQDFTSSHGNYSYYYDSDIDRYCLKVPAAALKCSCTNFPTGNSPFTLSVNVKVESINVTSNNKIMILGFGSTPWSNTVAAIAIDKNKYFYATNWSNTPIKYSFQLNTWYKVTSIFDGTTTKLYIDNDFVASGNINYDIGNSYVSINTFWTGDYFTGYEYNAFVFNRAISEDEMILLDDEAEIKTYDQSFNFINNEYSSYQIFGNAGLKTITYTSNNLPEQLTMTSGGLLSGMFTSDTSGVFNVELSAEELSSKIINVTYKSAIGEISASDQIINFELGSIQTYQISGSAGDHQILYTSNNLPSQLNMTSGGLISGQFNEQTSGSFDVTLSALNYANKTINIDYLASNEKSIIIDIGVDMKATITLLNNNQLKGVSTNGDVGMHSDLKTNYPWLYFGYNACWVDDTEWKWTNNYTLPWNVSKIQKIELLDSGRDLTKKSDLEYSGNSCSLKATSDTILQIIDDEGSSSRYYFKVYFK